MKKKLKDASRKEILRSYKKLKKYYFKKVSECQQMNLYITDNYKYLKNLLEDDKIDKNIRKEIEIYLRYLKKILNTEPCDKVIFQGEVSGCPDCGGRLTKVMEHKR